MLKLSIITKQLRLIAMVSLVRDFVILIPFARHGWNSVHTV